MNKTMYNKLLNLLKNEEFLNIQIDIDINKDCKEYSIMADKWQGEFKEQPAVEEVNAMNCMNDYFNHHFTSRSARTLIYICFYLDCMNGDEIFLNNNKIAMKFIFRSILEAYKKYTGTTENTTELKGAENMENNTITTTERNAITKNGLDFLHGKGLKELSFSGTLKELPELNVKQGTILAFLKQEFTSLPELKEGSFIRTSKIVNRFNACEIFAKEGTIKKFNELVTPSDIKKVLQYAFLTSEFNNNGLMLAYAILKNGDTEFILVNKIAHYVTYDFEIKKVNKSSKGSSGSEGSETTTNNTTTNNTTTESDKINELEEVLERACSLAIDLNLETVRNKIKASISEFELLTRNKNAKVTKKA